MSFIRNIDLENLPVATAIIGGAGAVGGSFVTVTTNFSIYGLVAMLAGAVVWAASAIVLSF